MHQSFDGDEYGDEYGFGETPREGPDGERMSYEDKVAFAWCLVQEGFCDFRLNSTTGEYDFALNERGKEAHRQAHGGESWS